jgi:class 3 adenylate cyclase
MVGSTDMTQAKGDAAAQEVVRRHNGIVRQALAEFDGREVKHTGDGIMASFASTANAVDAAIAIQRAVAAHNATAPAIPVHLRIGINAGEPIQEEDDLFGTTVQLAARVCAKAEPEQVLCSNVVRELSQGKGRRFASLGEHDLKGFRDPVALYEVLWLERPAGDATTAAE